MQLNTPLMVELLRSLYEKKLYLLPIHDNELVQNILMIFGNHFGKKIQVSDKIDDIDYD